MAGTKGRSGGDRSLGLDTTPEDGLPTKPKLDPEVSKKWDQLLEQLPKASLRKIDQHELKLLSELLAYADKLRGDPWYHASVRIFLITCSRIHRLSGSFGLNPGDLKRLSLQTDSEEDDPFAEWLERYRGELGEGAEKRI